MDSKKVVKKHVAAIHCSNTLSLMQRKISNALLYHAYADLKNKEEHEISISQLCKILGVTSHNYDSLKEALKALVSTLLEWNVVNDDTGDEDWSATTILSCVRIRGAQCFYAYSPRMRDLLHSPSVYGQVNLIVQARFKSNYGLALYENCVRYRNLPKTRLFTLEEFRKLMGVDASQYPIFRDFKRRVISKAVEEVNTHSDVFLEPEYKRAGRNVTGICFTIKERPKKQRIGATIDNPVKTNIFDDPEKKLVFTRLTEDFQINPIMSEMLIKEYDVVYIQEKIQLVMSKKIATAKSIENLAGYLISAIKNDYQQPISTAEIFSKKISDEIAEVERQKEGERRQYLLEQEYANYTHEFIIALLNNMKKSDYDALMEEWTLYLKETYPPLYSGFKKEFDEVGLQSKKLMIFLKDFLSNKHPGYLKDLSPFEEYLEKIVEGIPA